MARPSLITLSSALGVRARGGTMAMILMLFRYFAALIINVMSSIVAHPSPVNVASGNHPISKTPYFRNRNAPVIVAEKASSQSEREAREAAESEGYLLFEAM